MAVMQSARIIIAWSQPEALRRGRIEGAAVLVPDRWRRAAASARRNRLAGCETRTAPLGERRAVPAVTQAQIAATIAELVGEDYRAFNRDAAPSLLEALRKH